MSKRLNNLIEYDYIQMSSLEWIPVINIVNPDRDQQQVGNWYRLPYDFILIFYRKYILSLNETLTRNLLRS